MKFRLFLPVLLALLFLVPNLAWAKKHKKHSEPGVVITDVNETARTIVITVPGGKGSLGYSVPTSATITLDQQTAPFSELKKGMHVVTYTEADEHILSQVDVQSTK